MAPTKPLVAQQIEACYKITGLPQDATIELTGTTSPEARRLSWLNQRVFFLTPQVMQNDLNRGTCPARKVVLLVVDEAHRATGNHAYCEVVRELRQQNERFRILALTATPGSEVKTVQKVIENLLISRIEIRAEDSMDIRPYIHERILEAITVPLSDTIISIRDAFYKILGVYTNKLYTAKAFYIKDPQHVTFYTLFQAREKWRGETSTTLTPGRASTIEGDFGVAMSLAQSLQLLLQHGIRTFAASLQRYADEADKEGQRISRARAALLRHPDFVSLMQNLRSVMGDKAFISHPKIERLVGLVVGHFVEHEEEQGREEKRGGGEGRRETRVMIFSQYRESVEEIVSVLDAHKPMVRVMSFVGQSAGKRSGSKGYTQKEQLEVISKFQSGNYNVLVATSIGEEGLDIGEVDLIICYDAQNSPIRMLQRMGRTGRKRQGKVALLLTEGREEDAHRKSQATYKAVQNAIVNQQGKKLKMYPEALGRMLPVGVTPICVRKELEIPVYERKGRGKSKAGKKSLGANAWDSARSDAEPDEGGGGPFLSTREMAEYNRKFRIDDEPARMEISKFLHWQTTELPVQKIGHSGRTIAFVACVKTMEGLSLDESSGRESCYGREMEKWLDGEILVGGGEGEIGEGVEEGRKAKNRNKKRLSVGRKGKSEVVGGEEREQDENVEVPAKDGAEDGVVTSAKQSASRKHPALALGYASPLARMFSGQKRRNHHVKMEFTLGGRKGAGLFAEFEDEEDGRMMEMEEDYTYEDPFPILEAEPVQFDESSFDRHEEEDDVAPLPPLKLQATESDVENQDVNDAMEIVRNTAEPACTSTERFEVDDSLMDDDADVSFDWAGFESTQVLKDVAVLEAAALRDKTPAQEEGMDLEDVVVPETPEGGSRRVSAVSRGGVVGGSDVDEDDDHFVVPETPIGRRVGGEGESGSETRLKPWAGGGGRVKLDWTSPLSDVEGGVQADGAGQVLGKRESPLEVMGDEKRVRMGVESVLPQARSPPKGVPSNRGGKGIKPWRKAAVGLASGKEVGVADAAVDGREGVGAAMPGQIPARELGPITYGGCVVQSHVKAAEAQRPVDGQEDNEIGFDDDDDLIVDLIIADIDDDVFLGLEDPIGRGEDVKGKGLESGVGDRLSGRGVATSVGASRGFVSPFRAPMRRASNGVVGVASAASAALKYQRNMPAVEASPDLTQPIRRPAGMRVAADAFAEEPSPDLSQPIRLPGRRRVAIEDTPGKTAAPVASAESISPSVKRFKRLKKKKGAAGDGNGDERDAEAENAESARGKATDYAARLKRMRQKRKALEANPFIDHQAEVSSGSGEEQMSEDESSEEERDLEGFVVGDSQWTPSQSQRTPGGDGGLRSAVGKSPGELLAFYGKSLMSPEFGGMGGGGRVGDLERRRRYGLHVTPGRKRRRWADEGSEGSDEEGSLKDFVVDDEGSQFVEERQEEGGEEEKEDSFVVEDEASFVSTDAGVEMADEMDLDQAGGPSRQSGHAGPSRPNMPAGPAGGGSRANVIKPWKQNKPRTGSTPVQMTTPGHYHPVASHTDGDHPPAFDLAGPSPIRNLDALTTPQRALMFESPQSAAHVDRVYQMVGDQLTILVDTREMRSSICSILRNKFRVRTEIRQLSFGDYIVSNRVAVERKTKSDLLGSVYNKRIFDQISALRAMCECPLVIVEQEKDEGKDSMTRTNQFEGILATLARMSVKVLFSDSAEQSAQMIFDLATREAKEGGKIDVPELLPDKKNHVGFLLLGNG
ncbi:hypothetical protein HDV00_005659 [Rhizophlyctis rosea]|nr:hypothetical protein HDV00_005659 [Rhizophlyctis rosea]